VVTGSAKGIGREIAERLATAGADLLIADILEEESERTAAEVEALGVRSLVHKFCKENFLAFSRKSWPCPSCEQKRMLLFADKVAEDVLLAVPHRFWTFSIPKAIRGILLRDRRLL